MDQDEIGAGLGIGMGASRRVATAAAILPWNSSLRTRSWRPPATRLVTLGKLLSSITTAEAPASS